MTGTQSTKRPILLRQRAQHSTRGKKNPRRWFGIPGLTLLFGSVGAALAVNFYYSLTNWNGFNHHKFIGLHNYVKIATDPNIRDSILHVLWFVIPFAIIPTALGCFLAAVLFDYIQPYFGSSIASTYRTLLYLPQIVPLAMTGVLWHWILDYPNGLINNYLVNSGKVTNAINFESHPLFVQLLFSIILIWLQVGFTLLIFIAGMSRRDPRVMEAAQIDGASFLQQLRYITIPLLKAELIVVILTISINALKMFGPVYWITGGGPEGATNVPSTFSFKQFYGGSHVGLGAAVASLFAIILGFFAYFVLKYQRKSGVSVYDDH